VVFAGACQAAFAAGQTAVTSAAAGEAKLHIGQKIANHLRR
jgi:hypothetical protein